MTGGTVDPSARQAFRQELRRHWPFDRIPEQNLEWLVERAELVRFAEGDVIYSPGVCCGSLYVIHTGQVVMEAAGCGSEPAPVLAEMGPGACFPLEALADDQPVFVTFRAQCATACFSLSRPNFIEFRAIDKVFADFCHVQTASLQEHAHRAYRLHFSRHGDAQQQLCTPLSLIMEPHPVTARVGQTVREVVATLYDHDTDAAIIIDENRMPIGIFTFRDLLRKVVVPGRDLNLPVAQVMTPAPKTLPASAMGYEASLLLAESEFHHVVLVDEGRLAGIVCEHDLLGVQRTSVAQVNDRIRTAGCRRELTGCLQEVRLVTENLLLQGAQVDFITRMISSLHDRVISRAIELESMSELPEQFRLCWLALGSEGRHEQTLTTDQDNGLIFDAPPGMSPDQAREILLPMARRVNRSLAEIGIPLCKGNIMAGNPACCLSSSEWQARFAAWIREPTPEALLNAATFFDFRFLHGDPTLADRLRLWLADAVQEGGRFFHLLAENSLLYKPPIGIFRNFAVENHPGSPSSIDIKANGVNLFVDAARVYALAHGVTRSSTLKRLLFVGDHRKWRQSEVNAWVDAFSFLQSLRLRRHFELHKLGDTPHNRLNPYELNNMDQKILLESLRQASRLQKQLCMDFSIESGSCLQA